MKTAGERFFDYCMRRCTCNGCHYERYCFPELNKKGETNEFKDERINKTKDNGDSNNIVSLLP